MVYDGETSKIRIIDDNTLTLKKPETAIYFTSDINEIIEFVDSMPQFGLDSPVTTLRCPEMKFGINGTDGVMVDFLHEEYGWIFRETIVSNDRVVTHFAHESTSATLEIEFDIESI